MLPITTKTLRFTINPLEGLTLAVIRARMRKSRQRLILAGYIVKTIWSGPKQEYLLVYKV